MFVASERVNSFLIASMLIFQVGCSESPKATSDGAPALWIGVNEVLAETAADGSEFKPIVFGVENRGNGDLQLKKLTVSCSCINVKPSKSLLKPGEAAEIIAHLDPAKSSMEQADITLQTNDPHTPLTLLRIRWKAGQLAHGFEPTLIDFGTLRPGQSSTATLKLRKLDAASVNIGSAPADQKIELATSTPSEMKVTVTAGEEIGEFKSIAFTTLENGAHRYVCPIRWTVANEISVKPTMLLLTSSEELLTGRLTVTAENAAKLVEAQIRWEDGSDSGLKVTREESRVLVEVSVRKDSLGMFKGRRSMFIRWISSESSTPRIEVPVCW